ncbi:MAG: DUF503 domain-containing protein [Lachnospiraceae bacterium]|nr:DUF503 domain-containing protein [Lachnospiraceae bacterium]
MIVFTLEVTLHAPYVHSLKEKRMILRSMIARLRNTFNISVAEVADQDIHQILVLGIAGVTNEKAQADSVIDHVITFIEENGEAQITEVVREFV